MTDKFSIDSIDEFTTLELDDSTQETSDAFSAALRNIIADNDPFFVIADFSPTEVGLRNYLRDTTEELFRSLARTNGYMAIIVSSNWGDQIAGMLAQRYGNSHFKAKVVRSHEEATEWLRERKGELEEALGVHVETDMDIPESLA